MAFFTTFSLLTRFCSSAGVLCNSPQNGTLGGVGIIRCSFESDFNTIVWSYTQENAHPLIRYDRDRKFPNRSLLQGPGHDNGAYSIRIDGALLIFPGASRPESKGYKVEIVHDEDHWEQTVVYQFVGESTTIHHQTTVSPTTCSITETTSSGFQGKKDCSALRLVFFTIGFVVGAVVGGVGAGVVACRKYKKAKKEPVPEGTSEIPETQMCIPGTNANNERS